MKLSCFKAIVLAMTVLVPNTHSWATDGQGYKRWAILPGSDLQPSGVLDLLMAKLSAEPGIELVERERIDAALRELGLNQALSDDLRGRLQLGRILGADALVILSRVTSAPPATQAVASVLPDRASPSSAAKTDSFVKIVIADCRQGARLRVDFVPCDSALAEQVAESGLQIVQQTRLRYASGLQMVIGVSPFLCRNLTHAYDQYQAGFEYLLEAALASPGVAVIETQEAQEIRQERDLSGSDDIQRIVPLFVEGEYEVTPAEPTGEPHVRLSIRLTRDDGVLQTIRRDTLPLGQTASFLVELAAPAILEAAGAQAAPLSVAAQVEQLRGRAGTFAGLGMWGHAAGLREAILLIEPKAHDQRISLLEDSARELSLELSPRIPYPRGKPIPDEDYRQFDTWCRSRANLYRRCLDHLEYLIGNKGVTQAAAAQLTHLAMQTAPSVPPELFDRARETVVPLEVRKKQFLREVYPLIRGLNVRPAGERNAKYTTDMAYVLWQDWLLHWCFLRVDSQMLDKEDLDFTLHVLTEVLPRMHRPSFAMTNFLKDQGHPRRLIPGSEHITATGFSQTDGGPWRYTDDQYVAFLEALGRSQAPLVRIYSRYGLLKHRYDRAGLACPVTADMLEEAESIVQTYARDQAKLGRNLSQYPDTYAAFMRLRDDIRRTLAQPVLPAAKVTDSRPSGGPRTGPRPQPGGFGGSSLDALLGPPVTPASARAEIERTQSLATQRLLAATRPSPQAENLPPPLARLKDRIVRLSTAAFTPRPDEDAAAYRAWAQGKADEWRDILAQTCQALGGDEMTLDRATGFVEAVLELPLQAKWGREVPGLEQERRRFLLAVLPLAAGLPYATVGKYHQSMERWMWQQAVLCQVMSPLALRYTGEDLDFLLHLLTGDIRQEIPGAAAVQLSQRQPWDGADDAAAARFLDTLAASDNPVNVMTARFGMLCRRYHQMKVDADMLEQIQALLDDLDAAKKKLSLSGYWNDLDIGLRNLRLRVQAVLDRTVSRSSPPLLLSQRGSRILQYEPIEVQVRQKSGRTVPLIVHTHGLASFYDASGPVRWRIERAADGMDLYWNDRSVLVSEEPGLAREIYASQEARLSSVAYDGRHVWIGSRRAGVLILTPQGGQVAAVGPKEGLPPSEHSLLVHPLEDGRAFACGSFGGDNRAWLAVIEPQDDGYRARVIHQATKVLAGSVQDSVDRSFWEQPELRKRSEPPAADTAFMPLWILTLPRTRDAGPSLLVGRGRPGYGSSSSMLPLRVGLAGGVVSVFDPQCYAPQGHELRYLSSQGILWATDGSRVWQWAGVDRAWPDGLPWREVLGRPWRAGADGMVSLSRGDLLSVDDRVYMAGATVLREAGDRRVESTGTTWLEYDPQRQTCIRLRPETIVPERFEYRGADISAHYGLVVWGLMPDRHGRHNSAARHNDSAADPATQRLPEPGPCLFRVRIVEEPAAALVPKETRDATKPGPVGS
jgi:hypothetical protein